MLSDVRNMSHRHAEDMGEARGQRLRATLSAWPALAFCLIAIPAAMSGAWVAVGLFCFSGLVLGISLRSAALSRLQRLERLSAMEPLRDT